MCTFNKRSVGRLSAFWERGSPDLPSCGLLRGSAVAQYDLSSSTQVQDPREGPSLAGRTTQGFLRGSLARKAWEEAERSRQGVPREVPMMHAMTIKTRRAPCGRQPAQCPRSLFGAKGETAGAEYRGIKQRFPYWCNETKTSRTTRRRSPWSPGGVTTRAFCRRRPLLSG